MKKRLLIVTDSLGAPRVHPELICYDKTWPAHVKIWISKYDYDVFIYSANGLSTDSLLKEVNFKLKLYNADIVIFQVGIVDCAPRVFSEREKLLFRIFHLHKLAAKIGKKYHAKLSSLRNKVTVGLKAFSKNIQSINDKFRTSEPENCKLVYVPIGPPCSKYFELSPNIGLNIKNYNNAIENNSDHFISAFCEIDPESIYMSDCHHLNEKGHQVLSQLVISYLDPLVSK